MIKNINGEVWKQILFPGHKQLRKKYAVSSHGRTASYVNDVYEDGKLLNGSVTSGYRTLNLHLEDGNGTLYVHREVARLFCEKKSNRHKYVMHLNHKKNDNNSRNLRWANQEEIIRHQQLSPHKIAYKKKQAGKTTGLKLNATQVRAIKEIISNPKRKLTYAQMAEKFKVSEMTLYRIKSGENWANIK